MARRLIHMRLTKVNDPQPRIACGESITKYQLELGSSYASGKLVANDWNYITCKKCLATKPIQ